MLELTNKACSIQHFNKFEKTLKDTLRSSFVHGIVCAQHLSRQCYISRFRVCPDLLWCVSDIDSTLRGRQGCALMPSSTQLAQLLRAEVASHLALPGWQGSAQHNFACNKSLQGFSVLGLPFCSSVKFRVCCKQACCQIGFKLICPVILFWFCARYPLSISKLVWCCWHLFEHTLSFDASLTSLFSQPTFKNCLRKDMHIWLVS